MVTSMKTEYIGAIEAGGTKMVCACITDSGKIVEKTSIPTTAPDETIGKIVEYFKDIEKNNNIRISKYGVGAFGPVDLNVNSSSYGKILNTPKTEWRQYDLLGTLSKRLEAKVYIDTDVNVACLGEVAFGCAKGLENVIYITIGTGIGVGVWCNNKLVHGMLHPEGGHMLLARYHDETFEGNCYKHGNCFEGMASGPAIEKMWNKKAELLTDNSEVWEKESFYIAQAILNYIYMISPQKIILGGGVMHQDFLFDMIRKKVIELNANYIETKELNNIDDYIVPCSLNDEQGVLGAMYLTLL